MVEASQLRSMVTAGLPTDLGPLVNTLTVFEIIIQEGRAFNSPQDKPRNPPKKTV